MKNLAYTGAAVGVTAIGYLGWKTYHEAKTGEEPGVAQCTIKTRSSQFQKQNQRRPRRNILEGFL